MEIAKRPHLWNVKTPNPDKIVEEFVREGIYKSKSSVSRDYSLSVTNYLGIIKEIQKQIENTIKRSEKQDETEKL